MSPVRRPKDKRSRRISALTCPQCGSADLYYEAALITGYKYHCKKCGYIGAFVIEKTLDEGDAEGARRSGEHRP
jgi:predicted RNA-binding Zn-ribbon protein involved in translation (DUF1610 family)